MKQKLFITGATGSVGHYLVEAFGNDPQYELYLLVQEPKRFKMDILLYKNLHIVIGSIENITEHKSILCEMNYVIHVATNWCGDINANIVAVRDLLGCFDPVKIKKMIFFSTASVLGQGNQLLVEAKTYGTNYIQSKYQSYLELAASPLHDKIIHVFPTVVISGDATHPYSHIGQGLRDIRKFIGWARFFSFDLGFHFIHCQDIARVVKYLLENEVPDHDYVLGNDYISARQFIRQVATTLRKKVWLQVAIPSWFVALIIKVFRLKLDSWAAFCIRYKHFRYTTVNCKTFGLPTRLYTVPEIVKEMLP